MTEKQELDIKKQLEDLLKGFQNLAQTAEKIVEKEQEEAKEDERKALCCCLSTKIKLMIHPMLTDDTWVNFSALCNIFVSYGVISGISKEDIKDYFDKELEFTIADYNKNKEKIAQIKKILKEE